MNRMRAESLYQFWSYIMEETPRSCVMTAANDVIYLDAGSPLDIGSFPLSIETAQQYLNPMDGDVVLMNDPYSGGSVPSSPTLVMGVGHRLVKGLVPSEIYVAMRITLTPRIGVFKSIDEEGLRIPPSPIVSKGEINETLLEALTNHPRTDANFVTDLRTAIKHLMKVRAEIKRWLATDKIDFSKSAVKDLLKSTQNQFVRAIEDYREGESTFEYGISPEEKLKLKVELQNGHLLFDFSGTSPGKDIFLTSTATQGTCIAAVLACLPQRICVNSGILNCFEVRTPKGSLVNSSFPQPLLVGHTDGVHLVIHAAIQALARIDERWMVAGSGYSNCHFEFSFPDGRFYSSLAFPGLGGSARGPGLTGTEPWRRLRFNRSVEYVERSYPLEIKSHSRRFNSGGAGKHPGGDGMAKTFKVLGQAKFSWFYMEPEHKPIGVLGGKTALGPAVILMKKGGEKVELASQGVVDVQEGDEITLLTPGGGGYGAPV